MRGRPEAAKNEALEALRGAAALTVFLYHCIQQWPGFPRGPFLVFHKGLVGVDLFLVISGYVTTSSLLALHASGRVDADREYWRRRIARIFPLFWLTSLAYVLVPGGDQALRGPDAWFQFLTHVTLTHGFFPSTWVSINAVTWTLTLEASLYVFGWLMLRRVDLVRHPGRWTVLVFAMVFTWRTCLYAWTTPEQQMHLVTQVFGAAEGFWLGLLMAHAAHRGRFAPQTLPSAAKIGLFVAGLLGVHALAAVMYETGGLFWYSPWCVVLVRTGLAVSFAALLCVALAARGLPRLLRPLARAGTISYGIYLWHLPVMLVLLQWDLPPWVRTVLGFAATIVLSEASYRLLEAPVMRWVKR